MGEELVGIMIVARRERLDLFAMLPGLQSHCTFSGKTLTGWARSARSDTRPSLAVTLLLLH